MDASAPLEGFTWSTDDVQTYSDNGCIHVADDGQVFFTVAGLKYFLMALYTIYTADLEIKTGIRLHPNLVEECGQQAFSAIGVRNVAIKQAMYDYHLRKASASSCREGYLSGSADERPIHPLTMTQATQQSLAIGWTNDVGLDQDYFDNGEKDFSTKISDKVGTKRKSTSPYLSSDEDKHDVEIIADKRGNSSMKKVPSRGNIVAKEQKYQGKLTSWTGATNDSTKRGALLWAVNCIIKLAAIGRGDPMVTLRFIVSNIPQPLAPTTRSQEARIAVPWTFEDAIRFAKDGAGESDFFQLVRCANLATQYRYAMKQEHLDALKAKKMHEGQTTGKKMSKSKSKTAESLKSIAQLKNVGVRALNISFAISANSYYGLLLFPAMELTSAELQSASPDMLVALIELLSNTTGSKEKGVPSQFAPIVDYVVERLIPVMEYLLCNNMMECFNDLCPQLRDIVAGPPSASMSFSFLIGGREISMPEPKMVDGSYKTNDLCSIVPLKTVKVYDDKVHILWKQHRKVWCKTSFREDAVDALHRFEEYWQIPSEPPSSKYFLSGAIIKPDIEGRHLSDEEWAKVNPRIAFWATFLHRSKQDMVDVRDDLGNTISFPYYSTAFNGALTAVAIEEHAADDARQRQDVDEVFF